MELGKNNLQELSVILDEMRRDSAIKNKKGIAFIGASIFVWLGILLIHLTTMSIREKNLYSWYAVAMLMPCALGIMHLFKIKLKNKENPLNKLGFLITINETLYISIACWVYAAVPEKMLMVLAMIFGAHLLLFGWLYQSGSYYFSAVFVTVGALIIGCNFAPWVLAASMLVYEILLTLCLGMENLKMKRATCKPSDPSV